MGKRSLLERLGFGKTTGSDQHLSATAPGVAPPRTGSLSDLIGDVHSVDEEPQDQPLGSKRRAPCDEYDETDSVNWNFSRARNSIIMQGSSKSRTLPRQSSVARNRRNFSSRTDSWATR